VSSHHPKVRSGASHGSIFNDSVSAQPLGAVAVLRGVVFWVASPLPPNVISVYNPQRPHRGSLIMESAYGWLVWIALGFAVAVIIAQWMRLLRKPATCLRCGGRLKEVDGT
jgi:hypothetical protein